MVNIFSFNDLVAYAQIHGYFLIFLIMIVEGPIMTVAAAFAASLGYFNIWVIFILSFFGDVIGDGLAYYIGYFSRKRIIEKYDGFFGIKKKSFEYLDEHFRNHLGKTLFIVKATPLVVPGLMVAGASRVPIKKYAFWNAVNIIPRTIFFTGLGYFFGVFAKSVLHYYNNLTYYVLAGVVVIGISYFAWKKISEKFLRMNGNGKISKELKKEKKS